MFAALPRPALPKPSLATLQPLLRRIEPRIPLTLKRQLLEPVLNRVFREPLADDEFYFLEGQRLGLRVKDLGLSIAFTCEAERLVVCDGEQADAWISGDAAQFMKLANRAQDPDTLFFQRKLVIEGDTELGLAVKNLLDSIDWSELPPLLQRGLGLAQRFA